jgi:hypothetical protein
MKKYLTICISFFVVSCGFHSSSTKKPLFEILAYRSEGGASIKFYEIISEPDEFKMIKNDPELKRKVKSNDINTCNFLILNLGEKTTGGYAVAIESAVETEKNIILTVKEVAPKSGALVTDAFTNPFCIVKINSKKEIIFN